MPVFCKNTHTPATALAQYIYFQRVSLFSLRGVVKSSSGESLPGGVVGAGVSSHPYKIPPPPNAIGKYDPDFPLRKTGNMLSPTSNVNFTI